jgi:selenocysteine-specific elongation factor SelB
MPVIATAGHVDHGKSALVLALTGTDPDRLREEKERGLTIDLGFAVLRLPSGEEVSIVDVPGHERFIKNMLAGVGGIDLALLVVAADEGVMPQTREHLAIIDLLGVERGVVALTKADLVDTDALAFAEASVRETLEGTTLEAAPIIACSAVTRQGLGGLLAAIQQQLARTPNHRDLGRARLPVDRAFSMPGFGTVVTGTLIDGSLSVGQDVELLPDGLHARVRGLQNHGRQVAIAQPGRRTAVNLAGVSVEELHRGIVLASPNSYRATGSIDVRLRAAPYLERPARHNLTVTFHAGASEGEARLLLLDVDSLSAGEEAWAQLRLAEPAVVVRGDRFIVRDPNGTLGGGIIVDTGVRRHRRFHGPTVAALEKLLRGSPEDALLIAVERLQPIELRAIAEAAGLTEDDAVRLVTQLAEDGRIVSFGKPASAESIVYTAAGFEALGREAAAALAEYHREFPLRAGMPREELRSRLAIPPRALDDALAALTARGYITKRGVAIALPSHAPARTAEQQLAADAYLASLWATPFSPPTEGAPSADVLDYLEARGEVVHVGAGIVFAAAAYEQMVARIRERLQSDGPLTLAEVRDMFGTSRRYAQALLEHLDGQRITRRVGDARVLASERR